MEKENEFVEYCACISRVMQLIQRGKRDELRARSAEKMLIRNFISIVVVVVVMLRFRRFRRVI